jgi:hypothetical protein
MPLSARAGGEPALPTGLAHVATASFLASRASPTAGFWIALAGGVALARAAERRGPRVGYGASLAAMLETVAIMGPARFGVPFTQALTAPLLGTLESRRVSTAGQVLACAAIRLLQNAVFVAFFVLVLAGGVDAYTDTYNSLAGRLPLLPEGTDAALIATGASLLAWAVFASTVQVLVYRRGLRRWSEPATARARPLPSAPSAELRRRFDPRAVAIAAAVAFVLLAASTAWALLAAVSVWLALAWATSKPDREVVPAGIVIALTLGIGVLVFAILGGTDLELALRRATRATLLVAVATWLRAAAGSEGLREVSRRTLGRLTRIPSVSEGVRLLDALGSARELGPAARAVVEALRSVPNRPLALLDAVLGWVAAESARFRAPPRLPRPVLSARVRDAALVTLAVAPAAALLG